MGSEGINLVLIIDVTAGNRAMHKNKNPPLTIFLDKEYGLSTPPDVFCEWRKLPIRIDLKDVIILFDPPHEKFGKNSVHMNPKGHKAERYNAKGKRISGTWWDSLPRGWAAIFIKAQKEFSRVAQVLCFKWNNSRYDIERPLKLFEDWVLINLKEHNSSRRRVKTTTYWATFKRKIE